MPGRGAKKSSDGAGKAGATGGRSDDAVALSRRVEILEDELQSARHTVEILLRKLEERMEAMPPELSPDGGHVDRAVRQRTQALVESEEQLRRKNDELSRLHRVKSEFLSVAAHELRTPLTSLIGYLDLIAEGSLGELAAGLKRPFASLRRNAHRLNRLVDDMLDATRLEEGRVVLVREELDLVAVCQSAMERVRPFADEREIAVSLDVPESALVSGDRVRLAQAVANLILDAIKHAEHRVAVAVVMSSSAIALHVTRDGEPVLADATDRIFQPFSVAHGAKHHTSGPGSAGLGLYIARAILELHGGTIALGAGPQKDVGATFTAELPAWRGVP